MFNKKPNRNFRQRKEESSGEEDGKKDEEVENGDRGEPVSVARPPKLSKSRGISCSSRREKVTSKSGSSNDEEAAEQKEEVAKVDVTRQANVLSFTDEKEVDENEFKVKRSVDKAVIFRARKKEDSPAKELAPKGLKNDAIFVAGSSEEECGGVEVDEGVNAGSDGDTSSQTSSSSSISSPIVGVIPDARQIRAARQQRRKARAHQDFIPLDGDGECALSMGVNEEDENHSEDSDDETDDHQRRIQFAPKPKTVKERIAEKIGGSEDDDDNSVDSEEENDRNMWEEQQIGKGVKRHKFSSCDKSQASVKHKKKVDIPVALPPVNIDVVKKRITGKLQSLREVHRAREANLRRMQLDMESAQATLEKLQNSTSDEQHRFYKDMRAYMQNLLECLTEKIVLINSAETDMHTLLIDQAEALLSRRREAVRKESSRLQQLAFLCKCSDKSWVFFGVFSQHCMLEADCKGESLLEEGEELEHKTADIMKRSQDIFADVQDKFSSVKKILSKLNEWRVLYSESYYNAYIGLCVPKLLSLYIRHQLIGWNPLKADGEDFEALPWYSAVENFCHGQGYEESENTDRETLPSIVQKTILPKVQGFVELVWDPLSSDQTVCLTKLCRRLENDYMVFRGEQSKQAKAFMDAVTVRLRSAVDEDVFIPLYPKKFLEDTNSQHYRFQDRQFWSAVKLLGNVTLWDGLVPGHVLMELALDKLLSRYIMMILLNTPSGKESVEKFKKVAECFPESWFQDVDTRSSIPRLQSFSSHLVQITLSLCQNNPDAPDTRETVRDVFVLLGNIKSLDSVVTIAEKYHYEDIRKSLNLL
ncbi:GC-rich sequence DNA-binding factor 2 isoform X2 [Arapaima gigas]